MIPRVAESILKMLVRQNSHLSQTTLSKRLTTGTFYSVKILESVEERYILFSSLKTTVVVNKDTSTSLRNPEGRYLSRAEEMPKQVEEYNRY